MSTENGRPAWLFYWNPTKYDFEAHVLEGDDNTWTMNRFREVIAVGDRFYLWRTGPKNTAALRAVGRILSPARPRETDWGKYVVDVSFDAIVEPPITRDQMGQNRVLQTYRPFFWGMGTNFRIDDRRVIEELNSIIQPNLKPLEHSHGAVRREAIDLRRNLDLAATEIAHDVARQLLERIRSMKPYDFELLVGRLFENMGYEDVQVTPLSGDGGIDVVARQMNGLTRAEFVIQVKQTANVGRPVVQRLRGAVKSHQIGVLVTSGQFSQPAVEDSSTPGLPPITLIDGAALVQLLMQNGIGVRREVVPFYQLESGT